MGGHDVVFRGPVFFFWFFLARRLSGMERTEIPLRCFTQIVTFDRMEVESNSTTLGH